MSEKLILGNASTILRKELLAKILRIYDYFCVEENRKVFEESGFNYAKISRTFQLNGIELEAIMSYVCRYSRSHQNQQVCEVIAKARESKSDKNQKRLDNNRNFVNDERIGEIEALFQDCFTSTGEIKAKNNTVLSNQDFLVLKDELVEAIMNGVREKSTKHTEEPTPTKQENLEVIPKPSIKEESPPPPPLQKIPKPIQKSEDDDINKVLQQATLINADLQPVKKITKNSRNRRIFFIVAGAIVAIVGSMVLIARLVDNQSSQKQFELPANLIPEKTVMAEVKKDEKTIIREKIQGIKQQDTPPPKPLSNQEDDKESAEETQRLMEKAQRELLADTQIKDSEREIQIQMQRQEEAKISKQRRESYSEKEIQKNGKIKNGTLIIREDVFNVNDVLGNYKVLSINETYLDVLDIKDGYPFKIYIK